MLRSGIINPDLLAGLARLGHTDTFVIADPGLPVPYDVPIVDLSFVYGSPTFREILEGIAQQAVIESAILADEARETEVVTWVSDALDVPVTYVPHEGEEGLKALVREASLVVRTGEPTPYANVVLTTGVPF